MYHKLRFTTFLLFLVYFVFPANGFTIPDPVKPLASEEHESEGFNTYIVRVRRNPETTVSGKKWYESFLPAETAASKTEPRLIYAYSNRISGFAAKLTKKEVLEMKRKDGFVHAFRDRLMSLQTTHSPDFLGLQQGPGFWSDASFGKGVIIGVLDTGVSPNHPSFSDGGMSPPPTKWKGVCEFNASDCNNKLIGARNFVKGSEAMGAQLSGAVLQAPYDYEGHGTHTASTAGGTGVTNADVDQQATGTATGMAPSAHLAIYKVCGEKGCADSDILAALDSAMDDGVDVLSLSIGRSKAGPPRPFYEDATAIGAFAAIKKGIFVSCAAGNVGPSYYTLSNEAPWILTVGAGTMDRVMQTSVKLGSGDEFNGESLYQPTDFSPTQLPLVYPGLLGSSSATICTDGSLDGINVVGAVVVCDSGGISSEDKGKIVKAAGGAAVIIANTEAEGFTTAAGAHVLPASHVSYSAGLAIKSYINSLSSPTASVAFQGTVLGVTPSPAVAYFSSRGPNQADPNILKPDIIGPGMNVLAAWPFNVGTSSASTSNFNVISGTSMATPHLSGIAALLKSSHPDWSHAAIKSAIMTTADITGNDGKQINDQNLKPSDFFTSGAGNVNPTKANNPGLVYDISPSDYLGYLCGLPYTDDQVSTVAGSPVTCANVVALSGAELNYPSFMVFLSSKNSYTVQVSRTVTNVGAPSSTYTVQVQSPADVTVTVNPENLSFTEANQKLTFSVTFTGSSTTANYRQGLMTWSSTQQNIIVNSPLMVSVG